MPENPVSGNNAVLSRRYVDAFYALAEKDGAVDKIADEMQALRKLWDESPEWRQLAQDPRLPVAGLMRAVAAVAHQAGLSKLAANFLAILAQNRRLSSLPAIISTYFTVMASRRGEFNATVRTATPLSAQQEAALTASVEAITGGKTHITVAQDASLIGGLTIQWGSKFIDASVKNRIDQLGLMLKSNAA